MKINKAPLAYILTILAFLTNVFGPMPMAQAQDFRLPAPGVMVHLSPPLDPPILKGIKVHPDNPFLFDFILNKGDSELSNDQLKDESAKLVKYFLVSLTIPEKDLWVNLSPYEKDRIIPQSFGLTEMGRDLLAEDYMLKQITASLIYPEDTIGKKFWKRIYEEADKEFGTTNIPVNTFNKVWIVPEEAVVYENAKAGTAYVVKSRLKVMLEQDYLSLQKHLGIQSAVSQSKDTNQLGSQIVREVVIPELNKEVNEDKNFVQLRQVYNSLILATWYKRKIRDSILQQVYSDKSKVAGVKTDDPQEKEKIYQRYLRAFKKGVYNYIKEEQDPTTQEVIPRKYFSGGVAVFGYLDRAMSTTTDSAQLPVEDDDDKDLTVKLFSESVAGSDSAMQNVVMGRETPQATVELLRQLVGSHLYKVLPNGVESPRKHDLRNSLALTIRLNRIFGIKETVAFIKALNNPVYLDMEILETLLPLESRRSPIEYQQMHVARIINDFPNKTKVVLDLLQTFQNYKISPDLICEVLRHIEQRPFGEEISGLKRNFIIQTTTNQPDLSLQKVLQEMILKQRIGEQRRRVLKAVNDGQFAKSILILELENEKGQKGGGVAYIVHSINQEWSIAVSFSHAPIAKLNGTSGAFKFYSSSDTETPIGIGYPVLTNKNYRQGQYIDDFAIYLVKSRQPLTPLPVLAVRDKTIATSIGIKKGNFDTIDLNTDGRKRKVSFTGILSAPGDSGAPLVVEYEPGRYGVIGHIVGGERFQTYANVFTSSVVDDFIHDLENPEPFSTYSVLEPGYSMFRDFKGLEWFPQIFSSVQDRAMTATKKLEIPPSGWNVGDWVKDLAHGETQQISAKTKRRRFDGQLEDVILVGDNIYSFGEAASKFDFLGTKIPREDVARNRTIENIIESMNNKDCQGYVLKVGFISDKKLGIYLVNGRRESKHEIMSLEIKRNLSINIESYLDRVIWEENGRRVSQEPISLQGQKIGSRLFQLLAEGIAPGTVVTGQIDNKESVDYLLNNFSIEGNALLEKGTGRIVVSKFEGDAVKSNEISLAEVMAHTLIGHLFKKYAQLRLEGLGYELTDDKNVEALKTFIESRNGQGMLEVIYKKAKSATRNVKRIVRPNKNSRPNDRAMKGGIDLTPANMNLQTQNPGGSIKFHLDPAMLQQLRNTPGFVPVIINIQPVMNLKKFLGVQV